MNPNGIQSLRIFVVEDHADTLFVIKRQLERLGHTVYSASTLKDAVAELPARGCDVLLSDVGLPDGSGWDLPALVKLPPDVLTIAMTGRGLASDRQRSYEAGYRHHLVKPYAPAQLRELLAEAAPLKEERLYQVN